MRIPSRTVATLSLTVVVLAFANCATQPDPFYDGLYK